MHKFTDEMITRQLINPESIVVVGGSTDERNIGGAALNNLLSTFSGTIYSVNKKINSFGEKVRCFTDIMDLPAVDCALMCIPAGSCTSAVDILVNRKGCKAVIVLSAGFSETDPEGKQYEEELKELCDRAGAALIGPNCIGVITPFFDGTFCKPVPILREQGVTLISGSGSAIVYLLETAPMLGVSFSSVFSVGNSAQNGVEDFLEYIDVEYVPHQGPKVIMLFIEQITDPLKLARHASSLTMKGARICAVKAGATDAGRRAALAHTGALDSPEKAIDAMFRKSGIIRCYSRHELLTMAAAMMLPNIRGKNMAIITQAGGPGVLQTDVLTSNGISIPDLSDTASAYLTPKLHRGASVTNPIDLLATGTAAQLESAIDFCENECDAIDGIIVIWGSPGLRKIDDVCDVVLKKTKQCSKPIFTVLTSISNAAEELDRYHSAGGISFPDEALLAKALVRISNEPLFCSADPVLPPVDKKRIREVIDNNSDGYLLPEQVQKLLDAAGIMRVREASAYSEEEALEAVREIGGYPLAMKAVGPVHKTEVGGVALDIREDSIMMNEFKRMLRIPDTQGVIFQPMLSGTEILISAIREGAFGHLIRCGIGGVMTDILSDFCYALAPMSREEADYMIHSLKSFGILEGTQDFEGVNLTMLNETIRRVAALCCAAPEIQEIEINPILGNLRTLMAADTSILLKKTSQQ